MIIDAKDRKQILIEAITKLNTSKHTGLEIVSLTQENSTTIKIGFNYSHDYYYKNGATFNFSPNWFDSDWEPADFTYRQLGHPLSDAKIPDNVDPRTKILLRIMYYFYLTYLNHKDGVSL